MKWTRWKAVEKQSNLILYFLVGRKTTTANGENMNSTYPQLKWPNLLKNVQIHRRKIHLNCWREVGSWFFILRKISMHSTRCMCQCDVHAVNFRCSWCLKISNRIQMERGEDSVLRTEKYHRASKKSRHEMLS